VGYLAAEHLKALGQSSMPEGELVAQLAISALLLNDLLGDTTWYLLDTLYSALAEQPADAGNASALRLTSAALLLGHHPQYELFLSNARTALHQPSIREQLYLAVLYAIFSLSLPEGVLGNLAPSDTQSLAVTAAALLYHDTAAADKERAWLSAGRSNQSAADRALAYVAHRLFGAQLA